MNRLTLSINQQTVEAAKNYAKHHGTSVSKLVTRFLANLEVEQRDDFFTKLHRELKQEGYNKPLDDNLGELRSRHLRDKYL